MEDSQYSLTIAVPTWNRADFLAEMLKSAVDNIAQSRAVDQVEILVCDNASTDHTPDLVARIQRDTDVRIRYHRNDENVGMIRNFLRACLLATGKYIVWYGDDDVMLSGGLQVILDAISTQPEQLVFLFNQQETLARIGLGSQPVSLSCDEVARSFFWHLGNASILVVSTVDAKTQIQAQGEDWFRSIWMLTEVAFLVMHNTRIPAPCLVSPSMISSSHNHAANTVYTASYFLEVIVLGLYKAALDLRPLLGERFFSAATDHLFAMRGGQASGLAGTILLFTAVYDTDSEVTMLRSAIREIWPQCGRRARFWLGLFYAIALTPRPARQALVYLAAIARRPLHWRQQIRWLREKIATHRQRKEIAAARKAGQPRTYAVSDIR